MKEAIGFFAVIALTFVFIVFTINDPIDDGQLFTDDITTTTETYVVDSNWSDLGVLEGLESDGDLLYPTANNEGTWTSFIQQNKKNRIIDLRYSADMRDGNGNITVRAWTDDPSTTPPDEVVEFEMSSGDNSRTLDFNQYNFFESEIYMNETAGSSNLRPHVDRFVLDYEVAEGEESEFISRFFTLLFITIIFVYIFAYAF